MTSVYCINTDFKNIYSVIPRLYISYLYALHPIVYSYNGFIFLKAFFISGEQYPSVPHIGILLSVSILLLLYYNNSEHP